jgi:hypothetical protein
MGDTWQRARVRLQQNTEGGWRRHQDVAGMLNGTPTASSYCQNAEGNCRRHQFAAEMLWRSKGIKLLPEW